MVGGRGEEKQNPLHTLSRRKQSPLGGGKKEGGRRKSFPQKYLPHTLKSQAFLPNNSLTHLDADSHLNLPPLHLVPVGFFHACTSSSPEAAHSKGSFVLRESSRRERGRGRESRENLNCEICFKKKKKKFSPSYFIVSATISLRKATASNPIRALIRPQ